MKYRVEVEMRTVTCAYAEIEIEANNEYEARNKAKWLTEDDLDFGPESYPDVDYNVTFTKEII